MASSDNAMGVRFGPDWLWPLRPYFRRLARKAVRRCYGVPYLHELSWAEHRGMRLLEVRGEVEYDDVLTSSPHWHRLPDIDMPSAEG